MNKQNLGRVVREGRAELRMTQRKLAEAVGVKASHIAYIEGGHRRPSLTLLRRIADTLGLDRRTLLFLSHPDAKYLVGDIEEGKKSKPRDDAFRKFAANRPLLRRHGVTQAELRVLKKVSMLEHISDPRHFLFVLNAIRQAGDRDA